MLGDVESVASSESHHAPGLSVLAVRRIFELLRERSGMAANAGLRISYLEIYNE